MCLNVFGVYKFLSAYVMRAIDMLFNKRPLTYFYWQNNRSANQAGWITKAVGQKETDIKQHVLRKKRTLLTIIELITVTGNNLESVGAVESFLEFIPLTLTMLATVTQLDDDSQRRRSRIPCIIGAEPTTLTRV